MPDLIERKGLTWERQMAHHASDQNETWYLAIDGLHVWIKNYGDNHSDFFSGWRVGTGGSPGRQKFSSREEAMEAAHEVVRREAKRQIIKLRTALNAAYDRADQIGMSREEINQI